MPQRLLQDASSPHAHAMRAMFAARKHVFVDLLKWDLSVLGGAYEIDQFDDPYAEYLILLDEEGRHRASARLLRTDRPHILGDLYPSLCAGQVPTGPTTREITRFCLDRDQSAAERVQARNQLVSVLARHALRHGITDYTGVAEMPWLRQILRFGWQAWQLGPAVRCGSQMLGSLNIRVDGGTIEGLHRAGVYARLTLQLVSGLGGAA